MPRISSSTTAHQRQTKAPKPTTSRRVLIDVSNKRTSRAKVSKKQDPESQGVRRSKRLSADASIDSTTVSEEAAPTRKKNLRSSTVAQSRLTAENSTHTRPPAKKKAKTLSLATSKRVRSDSVEVVEPPKKALRGPNDIQPGGGSSIAGCSTSPRNFDVTINPCADILQNGGHGLQRRRFDASKYIAGVSNYDTEHRDDVQEVTCYVTDIYQRLYDCETQTRPRPYMDDQPELNSMMRAILVDWIVEVHMKFRLLPETLYLCINIIDRYLSFSPGVPRKRLQLVGVTALLLACKYEEIYPPEVKDCVYITDRAYTRQDVLDMEAHIVKTLKFRMTVPTGYPFLQRFLHVSKATRMMRHLANFYMERMLQEYGMLNYRPSIVAASAVSLAMNNPDLLDLEGFEPGQVPGIPKSLLDYTGFRAADIQQVAILIESKVGEIDTTYSRRSLVAVKRKYESERYDCVSDSFRLPKVEHLGVL